MTWYTSKSDTRFLYHGPLLFWLYCCTASAGPAERIRTDPVANPRPEHRASRATTCVWISTHSGSRRRPSRRRPSRHSGVRCRHSFASTGASTLPRNCARFLPALRRRTRRSSSPLPGVRLPHTRSTKEVVVPQADFLSSTCNRSYEIRGRRTLSNSYSTAFAPGVCILPG